jgi:uncharacterized membrane protein YidH (DUF202 family)
MGQVDILAASLQDGVHQLRPWVRRLARLGLGARGVVYLIVGGLAAQHALGSGGETTDSRGAIRHLGHSTFGDVLLVLVAAGLLGYAAWRFLQAIHDTEGKGSDAKGLAVRLAYAGKGLVHAGLALTPIRMLARGDGGRDGQVQSWTARLMAQEWGTWMVAGVGVAVIGAGLYQVVKGVRRSFRDHLDGRAMSPAMRRWAERAGTFGYVAHGVVFGIVGGFLVQAARRADPGQAKGLEAALDTLLRQPHGQLLLAAVALGLVAYGLLSFVEARYRAIRT